VTRLAHILAASAVLVAQLGGRRPTALDQLDRAVRQPAVPSLPPAPIRSPVPSGQVWVPDRFLSAGDGTNVHVPGHWERPIPSTGENYVPPLVVCGQGGACATVPSGTRQPPEQRQTP
jgi:hypothetical protein